MSGLGPDATIKRTKSLPRIELTSPILVTSDQDSQRSYKSCKAVHEQETLQKSTERRSTVKALIEKHKSFQDKLLKAKINNFNTKKKSFANACQNLCASYNDCIKMDGDSKHVENVESFVRLYYLILTTRTQYITLIILIVILNYEVGIKYQDGCKMLF